MADGQERTEAATPKRREEARRKGQVPKSQEVVNLVCLLSVFMLLKMAGGFMWARLSQYTIQTIQASSAVAHVPANLVMDHTLFIMRMAMTESILILTPVFLAAVAAGIFSNLIQVGFLISGEALNIKLDKLDPFKGLQRMLSARSLIELVKGLAKVGLVTWIAYASIRADLPKYNELAQADLRAMVAVTALSTFNMVVRMVIALLFVALLDYLYQRMEFEKSIRMTKQEVKDEFKQREGDPMIKARVRDRMRQMAMQKMLTEVPRADVVITNPIHYAVALLWTEDMPAPQVLAKGAGEIARRIREIAEENRIMIVEDPPLAQALYKTTEPGEWIPPDLFRAAARVLAFVYRSKGKHAKLRQTAGVT